MSKRLAVRDQILALDPVADCEEVLRLSIGLDFPWDTQRALELALYRTYAVPSVSELLDTTQEFARRAQKRYDDTGLLLNAPAEHGLDSPQGREGIRRINAIHRQFDISNDDFLYVLSTFVVVPLRFIERWGWRELTEHERVAMHEYYKGLGRRMAIDGIPDTWQEMAAFSDDFEAKHFARTRETTAVADATLALVAAWVRLPLRVVRPVVATLMDARLRDAFGYRAAPAALTLAVTAALKVRARVERHLPPRRKPARAEESWFVKGYRDGYVLSALGPAPWGSGTRSSA